jgi:hypothetical protein
MIELDPELLAALVIVSAAVTVVLLVILIVLALEPHTAWIGMIMFGWIIGVLMQIVAGTMARLRT